MTLIDDARSAMDLQDYIVAVMVESIRASEGSLGLANGASVAQNIGGATPRDVIKILRKLHALGVLDKDPQDVSYRLTHLGAELLETDVENFTQSQRELKRRDHEMLEAISDAWEGDQA